MKKSTISSFVMKKSLVVGIP